MTEIEKKEAMIIEKARWLLAKLCIFIGYLIDKLLLSILIFALVTFCLCVAGISYQLYNDVAIGFSADLTLMPK